MDAVHRPNGRAARLFVAETGIAYLYLAPAIVLLLLFQYFPAVYAFWISLHRWGLIKEAFVGLENYQRLLVSEDFWKSLGVTVWYVVLAIPAQLILGLLIAYLLFQPIRGRAFYRTGFFLPTSRARSPPGWSGAGSTTPTTGS